MPSIEIKSHAPTTCGLYCDGKLVATLNAEFLETHPTLKVVSIHDVGVQGVVITDRPEGIPPLAGVVLHFGKAI